MHPHLLRRAEDTAPAFEEKRTARRDRVLLAGKLADHHGAILDCSIRNINDTGAKVHLPAAIGISDSVALLVFREGLIYPCRRVWSRAPFFGLEFLGVEEVRGVTSARHASLVKVWETWIVTQAAQSETRR